MVIRAKKARRLSIRIPGWVRRSQLVCQVNGAPVEPDRMGAFIVLDGLPAGAVVTLLFPLERETVTLPLPSMNARQYRGVAQVTATFKGSTCIGLAEPEEEVHGMQPAWVPLFRRPEYQQDYAPMRDVPYHVVERPIRWY